MVIVGQVEQCKNEGQSRRRAANVSKMCAALLARIF